MSGLAETIARLKAAKPTQNHRHGASGADQLRDLAGFGANPGALRARTYLPAGLAADAPLVVVLHGCTQTAADYDHGAGWSTLADAHGFALLFPEQTRANNPNLCFNWFAPEDIARGHGEAESIARMVAHMIAAQALDPARVFVTGLSAGGAMAAVMLAAYPAVFAGGAVIAGLPYGTATSVGQALERMSGSGLPSDAALTALVRAAAPHDGPWPTLSVWHGSADRTVSDANASALLAQWRGLHALPAAPNRTDTVDGVPHRGWCDGVGRTVVEAYALPGFGHGTPLATAELGAAGPHMLEAGISSTRHIAEFWGLAPTEIVRAEVSRPAKPATAKPIPPIGKILPKPAPVSAAGGVQEIIEKALRTAGLMK